MKRESGQCMKHVNYNRKFLIFEQQNTNCKSLEKMEHYQAIANNIEQYRVILYNESADPSGVDQACGMCPPSVGVSMVM